MSDLFSGILEFEMEKAEFLIMTFCCSAFLQSYLYDRMCTETDAGKCYLGVSLFQRVLIVQAFRPDRLQSAILQFCTELLRYDNA